MKKLLGIVVLGLLWFNPSLSEDFYAEGVTPADLINNRFILHSVTPLPEKDRYDLVYTFKGPNNNIYSCKVYLGTYKKTNKPYFEHECYKISHLPD